MDASAVEPPSYLDRVDANYGDARIVFVVPTLNEAPTVGHVVHQASRFVHRVVVVDGHSDDDTCIKAKEAGAEVILQEGQGKGLALRTAFAKVDADLYIVVDGDATYDIDETEKMLLPILKGEADIVIGSRLKGRLENGAISRSHLFGNWFFNSVIYILFGHTVTDSQSGFRAVSKNAIHRLGLKSRGFEIETEITVLAMKKGIRFIEIPISYRKRTGSPSKLNGVKHGLAILLTILKIRTGIHAWRT